MTVAWAAVAVAAATVVANVVGVWWAGRTQRRLARADRLGQREIEVYVDLLRWVNDLKAIALAPWQDLHEALEAFTPPADLDVRVGVFASEKVQQSYTETEVLWHLVNDKVRLNEEEVVGLVDKPRESIRETQDFTHSLLALVPEIRAALAASERLKEAVREVTAPDTR